MQDHQIAVNHDDGMQLTRNRTTIMQDDHVVSSDAMMVTRNSASTSAISREGDLGDGITREVQLALQEARLFSREMIRGYIKAARDDDHPSEARKNRDSLRELVFPRSDGGVTINVSADAQSFQMYVGWQR